MTPIVPGSPDAKGIDAALATWRQGDVALGTRTFTHAGDPDRALTPECARSGRWFLTRLLRWLRRDTDPLRVVRSEVEGLVVVSQTCDVVRSCTDRPFVEVAPLVSVGDDALRDIEKGRQPARAFVPGVADRRLVADLDRVMTIEKSIVAGWTRTVGCSTDQQVRGLAQALARKRVRFAFPDDFVDIVGKLRSRLTDKHGKNSDEGRALRALREIRVNATPSWNAETVDLMFWFVRNDDMPEFEGKRWDEHLEAWLGLVPQSGRFRPIEGQVATLDDLTARDYVESDPLDLDHLSMLIED